MREVMKGRQASDRSPLKTAAGLITQHRTGPNPLGAVPSLSRAATIAATPPATQDSCDYLEDKTAVTTFSTRSAMILIAVAIKAMLPSRSSAQCQQVFPQTQCRFANKHATEATHKSTPSASFDHINIHLHKLGGQGRGCIQVDKRGKFPARASRPAVFI